MELSSIVFFCLFLAISIFLAWFIAKARSKSKYSLLISNLEKASIALQGNLNSNEKTIQELRKKNGELEIENNKLSETKSILNSDLAVLNVRYEELQKKLIEHDKELQKLQDKFSSDFKLIANSILEKNTESFSKTHQEKLKEILLPLKDKIQSFEENIEKKYIDDTKERSGLKQEIKQLMEMSQSMNIEAQNLTKALKGSNKKQGNWGEIILENLLESSGLSKGIEYKLQFSIANDNQQRSVPDAVIHLPGNKHVIIDSKVSLIAYERFCNAEEDRMQTHLQEHIASVKGHIKSLSNKNYQTAKNLNSPDFVLMFMPIESSFSIAVKTDQELFSYAWNKNVVLSSPSTLLATLRTIASVWKYEKQTNNAMQIAEEAGKMYDKFKNFVGDMYQVDKNMRSAQESFDKAFNKLSSGRGNLVSKAEKLRDLGIKTSKNLSRDYPDLIDDTNILSISEKSKNENI